MLCLIIHALKIYGECLRSSEYLHLNRLFEMIPKSSYCLLHLSSTIIKFENKFPSTSSTCYDYSDLNIGKTTKFQSNKQNYHDHIYFKKERENTVYLHR